MKKFALAAAFAGAASTAFAGNTEAPIIETPVDVIVDSVDTGSSSSTGLIIPLILIALIAAAAS